LAYDRFDNKRDGDGWNVFKNENKVIFGLFGL